MTGDPNMFTFASGTETRGGVISGDTAQTMLHGEGLSRADAVQVQANLAGGQAPQALSER